MNSSSFVIQLRVWTKKLGDEVATLVIYLSNSFPLDLFFQVSINQFRSIKERKQVPAYKFLLRSGISYLFPLANDVANNICVYLIRMKSQPIISAFFYQWTRILEQLPVTINQSIQERLRYKYQQSLKLLLFF